MSKNQHLVAYIDILGFRNHVTNYFSGKDKKQYNNLKRALKGADRYAIQFSKKYFKTFRVKHTVKQFSDCITISMPIFQKANHNPLTLYSAFTNIVRVYQFILLDQEILIRGGISLGGHIEDNNMIFSEALIESYRLESEKAIYPRIVISPKVIDFIKFELGDKNKYDDFDKSFLKSIMQDWDDEFFLNPFGLMEEFRYSNNLFGDEVREVLESVSGKEFNDEEYKEFLININDEELILRALAFANKFLQLESNGNSSIILKYKWLREFCHWNLNPSKSKIIFARYFAHLSTATNS